jgi:uncharacterized protein (DUF3084 family)
MAEREFENQLVQKRKLRIDSLKGKIQGCKKDIVTRKNRIEALIEEFADREELMKQCVDQKTLFKNKSSYIRLITDKNQSIKNLGVELQKSLEETVTIGNNIKSKNERLHKEK